MNYSKFILLITLLSLISTCFAEEEGIIDNNGYQFRPGN